MRDSGSIMRLLCRLLIPVRSKEVERGLQDEQSATQEEERRARGAASQALRRAEKRNLTPPAVD